MAMRDQDRRERRRGERRIRRFTLRMWLLMGGVVLGFVAILGVLIASSGDGGERSPQVGDHWHADYTIILCGETLPDLPFSEGGVHTHGDGLIHMHPTHPAEAGSSAHLARFIASAGGRLTDTSLKLSSGQQYTNGEPCPDGRTGQVFLRVNGIPMTDIAIYVPRDGDKVELGFEA